MTDAEISREAFLAHLSEDDFEQIRLDTKKLVLENEILRRRIAHLECQIVTHAWAGWSLH